MKRLKEVLWIGLVLSLPLSATSGKKVFETYCWGCHHQTAVAFGPPFSQIASKRSAEEIRAMIVDPKRVSKLFGYKRNAMPAFTLKEEELKAISRYILSYAPKEANTTDANTTHRKEKQ